MPTDIFPLPVTSERVANRHIAPERCTHDSDHAECGGVFIRLRHSVFACRARVHEYRFSTVFRPYISSVGPNWISFFSNNSVKVRSMHVKLSAVGDSWIFYRNLSTYARYHFRFRHRAPLKIFRFSRLSRKRGYMLYRVVPRFKGHVTPYKTA